MFAGDRKGEAVPLMPSMVEAEPARRVDGGADMAAMGAACGSTGEPQQWFGAIRSIEQCFVGGGLHKPGRTPLGHADVNGDTLPESFRLQAENIVTDGEVGGCQIWLETYMPDGDDFVVERACVLSSQQLASWMEENGGGLGEGAGVRVSTFGGDEPGWVDMDGDGDLDLWLTLYNLQTGNFVPIWLKNTGFEKQQFAAGDINQDGYVDGVDMAYLLSDWTGG